MTLDQVLACFPSISDWEDSYLKTGEQRLLGEAKNFQVEILLESDIRKVAIFFDRVEAEMVSLLTLVTGDTPHSLSYLKAAAAFAASNPNTSFQRKFRGFSVETTQHLRVDGVANSLVILPILDLQSPAER